ncbi:MAG: aspartate/glutamate racemase family protein [Candidatus Dormibacteraeota bacterium]|nr:aspartate/glutamate racemase family protein [Candidatus Dormibacteraeota bacterium]
MQDGGGTVRGGRNLYGFLVGMVMTDSRFPRVPGDNGNAATWPFPVLYRVVPGAGPARVVRSGATDDLFEPFADAAQELERAGVELVTTGCGFLVLHQRRIQERLRVPFLSSSLLQVPWVAGLLPPGAEVGVLTIERASLTAEHLAAAGIDPRHPVRLLGLDEMEASLVETILGDRLELDVARARAEMVAAARTLVERHPAVRAIVLECTNLPPYRGAVGEATGLPVYDLTTLVGWAAAGFMPGRWEGRR